MRISIIDGRIARAAWLSLAMTSPLFGVPFFRLEIAAMEIPIPMYSFAVVFAIGVSGLLLHARRIRGLEDLRRYRLLAVLCLLFLFWHLASLIWAETEFR